MIKECINCRLSYKVRPYRQNQSKFCSYDCYWGKSKNLSQKKCSKCHNDLSINCFIKINRGWSSSCKDCKKKEWKNWSRRNDIKNRYRFYKWNAKRNFRNFEITEEQFRKLIEKGECYYCGSTDKRLGLDRLDSSLGYELHNIVVACRRCNIAKNDMEVKEFIRLCSLIAKRHVAT